MPGLNIERSFATDLQTNWSMWTVAENFAKWYGPQPGPAQIHHLDVRTGGTYKLSMGEMEQEGTYQIVDAPRRLKMGPADGSAWMEMEFIAQGDKTKMVLSMDGVPEDYVPMVSKSWETSFAKLDALLGD